MCRLGTPSGESETTPPTPSSGAATVCGLNSYQSQSLARGEADFERQTGLLSVTFVDDVISALPAGVAKSAIDQVQAKLSSCTTFTSTVSGDTVNFSVSPLSLPRVGDQTLALRLTGQVQTGVLQNATIPVDVAIIRVGNNAAILINGGINGVDSSLTEDLAKKQADKLASL